MKRLSAAMLFGIMILALMVPACRQGFERQPGEEQPVERPTEMPKGDNPLGLPADAEIVPDKYPILARVDSVVTDDSLAVAMPPADSIADEQNRYESYRIQLFTSKTYGPAVHERAVADEVFDQVTWLDYEVPYYKVRVGDFDDREAAEAYLPAVKEAGYPTAWVVKVNLEVWRIDGMYDDEKIPPMYDSTDVDETAPPEQEDDTTEYYDD
ncbi:MAG: SPOR domain-containing protein [candidate division Zixibacteria bacterium]|nr:SPOR domain-containing protein [candidate division Zixibacteria bacterium]